LAGAALKILFLGFPAQGHVNPSLGLVRELARRGHRVTCLLTEAYREKVQAAGGVLKPYPLEFEMDTLELRLGNWRSIRRLVELFRCVLAEAEREIPRFDFVFYDSLIYFGQALAARAGVPSACSVTTFAVNDTIVTEALASGGPGFSLVRNRFIRARLPGLLERIAPGMVPERLRDVFDLMKNPLSGLKIVYTTRSVQPHADEFDETFLFIGPAIYERVPEPSFPLERLKGRVVYVSMGTIANAAMGFYKRCLEAFADWDVTVVMSVGRRIDVGKLRNVPGNFLVFPHVPQLEVLRRADAFITHGGMNGVSEGLYYGVPLVVIPQSLDQPLVARRIRELEAGVWIPKKEVTAASLRDAVRLVLEDGRYGRRCREIAASFRAADGCGKAAEEIERMVGRVPGMIP